MTAALVLDTHALLWWTTESARISKRAATAIQGADELAVAAVTWYELSWLAHHDRITVSIPIRTWLSTLSRDVRTLPITPDIADTAASLPQSFPGDPADRLIFATAVEHGSQLVSRDRRLRDHPYPRQVVLW